MFKMLKQVLTVGNEERILKGATRPITSMVFLEDCNLLAVASIGEEIRVYDLNSSSSEPKAIFREHKTEVKMMIQLGHGLIASIGEHSYFLKVWRAADARLVGQWSPKYSIVHDRTLNNIMSLKQDKILMVDSAGMMTVLSYDTQMIVLQQLHEQSSTYVDYPTKIYFRLDRCDYIHGRAKNGSYCAATNSDYSIFNSSGPFTYILSNYSNEKKVIKRSADDNYLFDGVSCSIAANDEHVIIANPNGRCYIYKNHTFDLELCHDTRTIIEWIRFLNSDVFLAIGSDGLATLNSISQKAIIGRCSFTSNYLHLLSSFVVLDNNRVAIGKENGYCAVRRFPERIRPIVRDIIKAECAEENKREEAKENYTIVRY